MNGASLYNDPVQSQLHARAKEVLSKALLLRDGTIVQKRSSEGEDVAGGEHRVVGYGGSLVLYIIWLVTGYDTGSRGKDLGQTRWQA
eukprot:CAMPEP_0206491292 /NCGR_PEP_ID=MMETSP0324_2-20121206/44860_1 /ASSEMBLY_ACC=CAM_ASM_000836 /TAXON_ID=2866 /ORGANISM="Crypthecodinium cohnii, Strain Seligo" /LENGTH=86 /DNA_ID=CAMNT_0053972357 /DNA_START=474 /DNA_END=734 /DNA_ORIENTATION=+